MSHDSHVLAPDTRALLSALAAINGKVPDVALALLEGRMAPQRQREFAGLLAEVAELLRAHAAHDLPHHRAVVDADGDAPDPPTTEEGR